MKTRGIVAIAFGITTIAALAQIQNPAGKTTGPGIQAANDSKEPDILKTCKVPPPARGGGRGRGAAGPARGPAPTGPVEYTVAEIPGVVAAGAKWTEVIAIPGNNADGIIATKDGGILMAQNDLSDVAKLDKNGKLTVVYSGLNTSGSLAPSSKGKLFVLNRGINPNIMELPSRKILADKFNGDPLDCLGGVLNDAVADSKGGVYFSMGGLYYATSKGVVTRYDMGLQTNGIILSPDEKHVYVTNAGTLVAFDVQPDGSLTNQHVFATWEGGGGDGSTFDAAGRLYVTAAGGVQVISPDGKFLGKIPTPRNVISLAFSGKDRKTLYAVARQGADDWIITIPMLAQGPKGRGK